MTFIEDGNEDMVDKRHINYEKIMLLGAVVSQVKKYQRRAYKIKPLAAVQRYLQKTLVLPDDPEETIYAMSLEVEPKAAATTAIIEEEA